MNKVIDLKQTIEYEITGRFWPSLIWFEWGQTLITKYLIWKTRSKYKRYINFKQRQVDAYSKLLITDKLKK